MSRVNKFITQTKTKRSIGILAYLLRILHGYSGDLIMVGDQPVRPPLLGENSNSSFESIGNGKDRWNYIGYKVLNLL